MRYPSFRLEHFWKATRSESNPPDCVHIARGLGWTLVRDTKQVYGSATDYQLAFPSTGYDAFQEAIRAHNLRTVEIPAGALDGLCIAIDRLAPNINVFRSTIEQDDLPHNAVLVFTDREIEAYFDGVHNHEFDNDGEYTAHTADCPADCVEPNHVDLVTTG